MTSLTHLSCFDYNSTPIRAGERDGEPQVVLADVCRVLDISNPSKAAERLDDDEKGLTTCYTPGGQQQLLTINESGLYHLIMRSTKPEAKAFRKWVTSEVLPSIRRHGSYVAPNATAHGVGAAAQSSGNLAIATDLLKTLDRFLPAGLCAESRQTVAAGVMAQIGIAIPAPEIDERWSMSEIAAPFGIGVISAGKLCSAYDFKARYGKRLLTKAPSGKQVPQWHYNRAGRTEIEKVLRAATGPVVIGEWN